MTRFFSFISVLLIIVSLASCKSSTDKASETVVAFASAVASSDSVSVVKYYPATKDFYKLLPQIGEVWVIYDLPPGPKQEGLREARAVDSMATSFLL